MKILLLPISTTQHWMERHHQKTRSKKLQLHFKCELCHKAFTRKDNFVTHTKSRQHERRKNLSTNVKPVATPPLSKHTKFLEFNGGEGAQTSTDSQEVVAPPLAPPTTDDPELDKVIRQNWGSIITRFRCNKVILY